MNPIARIIELRVFTLYSNFPILKTYMRNLWAIAKSSEKIIDTYLKDVINVTPGLPEISTGDILKIRNNVVKYKKLIYEGNGINIFQKQKTLQSNFDISKCIQIPIAKKRRIYTLPDKSKLEIAKIEVFKTKYYTVCIESEDISEFIYLYNKFKMDSLLQIALKNTAGQVINGYNQFIHNLTI